MPMTEEDIRAIISKSGWYQPSEARRIIEKFYRFSADKVSERYRLAVSFEAGYGFFCIEDGRCVSTLSKRDDARDWVYAL